MPKIQKTVIIFTFLHPAADNIDDWTVDQILDECEGGDFVGAWQGSQTVEVPDDQVKTELQALGNDGAFFDDLED